MDRERFGRVSRIFEEALEIAAEKRGEFLDEACGGDADLRREVASLLAADSEAGRFMDEPVVEHGLDPSTHGPDATAGRRIGAYKLLRKAGEGGMSDVYLAVRADDEYQKRVALKVIRASADREDLLRRFRTERQILAGLDHPNISTLLDGGTTDEGLPYFVMEYIDGVPIDRYCDEHRLSIRERLELFRQVCSAVQYAHQNLVVHRDIKASNILVTADGTPRLLDFGIAKLLKPDQFAGQVEYTATWMRPMTPRYASPEQVTGRPVTTASDTYSLGVLLYKLLTGHLPYRLEGLPPTELSRLVVEEDPERPSTAVDRVETTAPGAAEVTPQRIGQARRLQPHQLQRQLSGDLDNIVLMALRKEPQRRYASVERFSEDLRRYLEGLPVLARKDTLSYRTGKFLRRNRLAVGTAAAFVLLLIGFSVTMAMQATRIAQQRDEARLERDRAQQVVALLENVFEVSDPNQASGEEVTAREILDRGAEQVQRDLKDQPEIQATLVQAIGNVYRNLGLYDRAEPLLRQSLELRNEVLGEDDPDVASGLSSLGVLLRLQGRIDEAEPLLVEALEIRRRHEDSDPQEVARGLRDLAKLRENTGKYDDAVALYREAIALEQSAGGEGRELANIRSNLGIVLSENGDFAGAEQQFSAALELRRELLGDDHLLVAESFNNLGVLMGIQGEFARAEPMFREALAVRRRVLGADHPTVAESLNNLGRLLKEMGQFDESETLYREGLRVERERLGDDHPRVAILLGNLANLLKEKGDLVAAESLQREALATRLRVLGEEHPETGASYVGLGATLLDRGRPVDAEPLLRKGLAINISALAAGHWRISRARSVLGACLADLSRDAEAEPLLVDGFEGLEEALGPQHRRTREARLRLVGFYEARNRLQDVERYRDAPPEGQE
jgi:serine/threonine-protein kinase